MLLKGEMMLKMIVMNVGLIPLISIIATACDPCAPVLMHELVIEVLNGKHLISDANATVPFHQLRQAKLPSLGRRDGVTLVLR